MFDVIDQHVKEKKVPKSDRNGPNGYKAKSFKHNFYI